MPFELQQDLQYYLDTPCLILIYLRREARQLRLRYDYCATLTSRRPITIVKLNYDVYNGARMIPVRPETHKGLIASPLT